MNHSQLKVGGSVVSWDLAPVSNWHGVNRAVGMLASLGSAFRDVAPSPRTIPAAFQAAVAETIQPVLKGHKILVRPVKKTGDDSSKHFVVVDEDPEIKGDDRFTIINACSVKKLEAQPDDFVSFEDIAKFDHRIHEDVELAIRETFQNMRHTLAAATVGTVLADVIERMGGVPLRERGGMYWLPTEMDRIWEPFSQLIERAGQADDCGGRSSKIYGMHIIANEGMVECVGDQMQKSISARLAEYKAELMNENVRSATVASRRDRVAELRRQSDNFTQAFRRQLDGLAEQFEEVDLLLASYGMLESAVVEREHLEREEREGSLALAVA